MIRVVVLLAMCLLFVVNARADALSAEEKDQILDAHNRVRADVAKGLVGAQPSATNMSALIWDAGLERVAQGWANQCKLSHNPDRTAQYAAHHAPEGGRSPRIGENLFATSRDEGVPTGALTAWLAEQVRFEFGPVRSKMISATGHYTQLVWAKTRRVGCARASCPSLFSSANDRILICDYAPAGNLLSHAPYESGPTASNCPVDRPVVSDGLCVTKPTDLR